MSEQLEEYKKKLEAILFASGRRLSLDELARLARIRNRELMKESLEELKSEYDKKQGSLEIEVVEEGGQEFWKLTVRTSLIPVIQRIVTKTELTKSVVETLAYIAYKYPIKQSDLVKVRSNKCYDHLRELENAGYITRQKHGRTKLIKLTDKFFDYFDLPPDKVKDQFKDFAQLEKAIEEKEAEVRKVIDENKKKQEEARKISEKEKQEDMTLEPDLEQLEIDLIDSQGHKNKLQVFDNEQTDAGIKDDTETRIVEEKPEIEPVKDKLGELEVVDEPSDKRKGAHLGNLDVYEESRASSDKEKPDDDSNEEDDDQKEGTGEEEQGTAEEKEEKKEDEPSGQENNHKETVESEIKEQKESIKPQKDAEFGKGFSDEVNKYMESKAEARAEELTHPEQEKAEKSPWEEDKELIDMPEAHKTEVKDEEEPETKEEPDDEKQDAEEEINKQKEEADIPEAKDPESGSELPPMDEFDEKKDDASS